MKKTIAIMMLVLMGTMAIAQTSVWHGDRQIWTRGTGTESNPFLIESADNLAFLAYMVNKGFETEGLHFRLTTDINLNGSEDQQWVPIGLYNRWFNEDDCDRGYLGNSYGFTPHTSFRGHFDGGEHSISNIYVVSESYESVGLFGYVEGKKDGQVVEPAVIENVYVTSGYISGRTCGGIVGNGLSTTLVSRCWNGATITYGNSSGGIVGSDAYQVYNCYNIGNISGQYAGGIVGYGIAEIEECYNEGDISGTYSGGIYGYSMMKHVVINNCYNSGSIFADGTAPGSAPAGPAAGGIASFLFNGNCGITNCYNVGTVSSTEDAGCILAFGNNTTLENNYYINTCSAGGEGLALSEDFMRSQEFVDYLNGRNRNQVWALDVDYINDGFPILVEDNLVIAEGTETIFTVYPNPALGQFMVEGTGIVCITNLMGQVISTREINGLHAFVLPKGMYFISLNGKTTKVIVE